MQLMDKPRPFKLMLKKEVATAYDHVAADLKSEEGNYQIGVGTIASRLLEALAAHPELIVQLLNEYAKRTHDLPLAAESREKYETGKKHPKTARTR